MVRSLLLTLFFGVLASAPAARAQLTCDGLIPASSASVLRQLEASVRALTDENGVIQSDVPALFLNSGHGIDSKTLAENTLEVIHEDAPPFGHVTLRIAYKRVSFNAPYAIRFGSFFPKWQRDQVKPGQIGALIFVSKEKIHELLPLVEQLAESSGHYNVPPFSPYGSDVVIKKNFEGRLQYVTNPKDLYPIDPNFKGTIYVEGDSAYILTPNGFKQPLKKNADGDWTVPSVSCSSGLALILEKFFNVKIQGSSARAIKDQIVRKEIGPITDHTRSPEWE